jgi:hypothetical protein
MPRRLVYDVDVDVPAAEMYGYFTTVGYWEDLVGFYRNNGSHTDDAGTDVTFTHVMTAQDLPPIARRLVPRSFVVKREQHFSPFDESTGQAHGRFLGEVPAPVDITGDYILGDIESGSRMRLTSACRVRVPIIGGQIEHLVVGGLKLLFTHEGEFTAEWVAAHQ